MIVVLYIASKIWTFSVPWWMWIIAAFDGVASVTQKITKGA
jgi:hypothetical protein